MNRDVATLKQAKQILDIIAQTGASSEGTQSVISSGFLTDLFRASQHVGGVADIDRRDFQVLLGITEHFTVHVEPYDASAIEVQMHNSEHPRTGVLGGYTSPFASAHEAVIEVIPSDLIPGLSNEDTIFSVLSRLEKLKYRIATTHELIALYRQHSGAALSKDGIIGGTLSTNSVPGACLMFYWHSLYGPRLMLRPHPDFWGVRWWVAVVRI
jgi:hypothetical protein